MALFPTLFNCEKTRVQDVYNIMSSGDILGYKLNCSRSYVSDHIF